MTTLVLDPNLSGSFLSLLPPGTRKEDFYSPDQPRDSRGRFGEGDTEAPTTPSGSKMIERLTNSGGFTIHATGREPKTGYAVAIDNHSGVFDAKDFMGSRERAVELTKGWLKENAKLFNDPNIIHIGGWHATDIGKVVLDPVERVMDRAEAVQLGRDRNQVAIYDLSGKEGEISTGGTGGLTSAAEFGESAGHPFRGNQWKDGEAGPSIDPHNDPRMPGRISEWAKQFPPGTVYRAMSRNDLDRIHTEGQITSRWDIGNNPNPGDHTWLWVSKTPSVRYLDPGHVIVAMSVSAAEMPEPSPLDQPDEIPLFRDTQGKHSLPVDRILGVFDPAASVTAAVPVSQLKRPWDRNRPTARERGYSHAWDMESKDFLAAHPVCATKGCTNKSTDVHHVKVKGVRGGGPRRALCHSCHSSIRPNVSAAGVELGEAAGHPFRGNQWKDGESEDVSKAETKTADPTLALSDKKWGVVGEPKWWGSTTEHEAWTEAHAQAVEAVGQDIVNAMASWSWGNVAMWRDAYDASVEGRPLPPDPTLGTTYNDAMSAWFQHLSEASSPVELTRGMTASGERAAGLMGLTPGDTIPNQLSSWTSDPDVAAVFNGAGYHATDTLSVVMHLEPGAPALPISTLGTEQYAWQQEWMAAGDMRINDIKFGTGTTPSGGTIDTMEVWVKAS